MADCANITISEDAADGLITTAINSGYSEDFSDDTAGGLITDINYILWVFLFQIMKRIN